MDTSGVDRAEPWSPDPSLAKWADRQRFGPATDFNGENLGVLAKQHGGTPRGFYLWEGIDNEVYLGISQTSVVRRLRDHRVNYAAMQPRSFRYLPSADSKTDLHAREKDMTHDLQRRGFVVVGRQYTSFISAGTERSRPTGLTPSEEHCWLDHPESVNLDFVSKREPSPVDVKARSKLTYDRFTRRTDVDELTGALAIYLSSCVPYAATTEGSMWCVSCLPAWKDGHGKRLITVNMGMQEVLWFSEPENGGLIRVSMSCDSRELPSWPGRLRLLRHSARPGLTVHGDGGPYEQTVVFSSPRSFERAMKTSHHLRRAGAVFALDQFRKRGVSGRWADSHNALLVEGAYQHLELRALKDPG